MPKDLLEMTHPSHWTTETLKKSINVASFDEIIFNRLSLDFNNFIFGYKHTVITRSHWYFLAYEHWTICDTESNDT